MKHKLILIVLIVLWAVLFIINFAKAAESPILERVVPSEIAGNEVKIFAYEQVVMAFGPEHWDSFNKIVSQESWNWRITTDHYKGGYTKTGVKSSAYGLCGFLNSTWKDTGFTKTDDPRTQIAACIVYIEDRYGDPIKAWKFHLAHNWY